MSQTPRRRRRGGFDPAPGRGSGGGEFPLIPAVVIVVLVGLFFGGALAHFLGKSRTGGNALPTVEPSAAATSTALPVAFPVPHPAPSATAHPTPHPTAHPTASSTAAAQPSASPNPVPSRHLSVSPAPKRVSARPVVGPSPTAPPKATMVPRPRPSPVVAPTAALASGGSAERLVERYIDDLKRGDTSAAASMLADGSPTEAKFIDPSTRIESLTQRRNADGSYKVDADVMTSKGEYFITFTVSGGVITAKTAIKP